MLRIPQIPARLRAFGAEVVRSKRSIVIALAVATFVLGLLIVRNTLAQSDAQARAENEGDTLLALNDLSATLLDAETGQRGYILTGDPAYLQPYEAARRRYDKSLEKVQLLLPAVATSSDEARLRRLTELTRSKLGELDHTVSLARAGDTDVALSIVRSNLGKRDMDMIRGLMASLAASQAERRTAAFANSRAVEARLLPLMLLLWLAIGLIGWAFIVGERERARDAVEAEQAGRLRAAHDRTRLLAEELDHRVKNLFAVVISIIQLSSRKDAPGKEIAADIAARIQALALAHRAAIDGTGASARLAEIVRNTLAPFADASGKRAVVSGPEVALAQEKLSPIALIVHELATNAVKYGALSEPDGEVAVEWTVGPGEVGRQELTLVWRETGGPAPTAAAAGAAPGFGTKMTSLAAAQLGGRIERDWPAQGAVITLVIPLA